MNRTLLQQALDALHPQANRAFVEATKDALRYALAAPQPEPVTFEQAWATYEAKGYQYGKDALEQVRFGWEIAHEFALAAPPAAPADMVMVPRKELGDGISLLHQAMVGACDCLAKTHEASYHAESCFYCKLSKQCDKLEATLAAAPAPADWGTPHDVSGAPWQDAPAPVMPDEVLDSLGMHDAAVKLARRLGYTWAGGEWSTAPAVPQEPIYGKHTADDLVRGVLQTAAPAAPLTDERIIEIRKATPLFTSGTPWENSLAFARAIEQAHGIGGGGK